MFRRPGGCCKLTRALTKPAARFSAATSKRPTATTGNTVQICSSSLRLLSAREIIPRIWRRKSSNWWKAEVSGTNSNAGRPEADSAQLSRGQEIRQRLVRARVLRLLAAYREGGV